MRTGKYHISYAPHWRYVRTGFHSKTALNLIKSMEFPNFFFAPSLYVDAYYDVDPTGEIILCFGSSASLEDVPLDKLLTLKTIVDRTGAQEQNKTRIHRVKLLLDKIKGIDPWDEKDQAFLDKIKGTPRNPLVSETIASLKLFIQEQKDKKRTETNKAYREYLEKTRRISGDCDQKIKEAKKQLAALEKEDGDRGK